MRQLKRGIGLMSGTSLDGLDIAYCEFKSVGSDYQYKILNCKTVSYSNEWKRKLTFDADISAYGLKVLDLEFGNWMGVQVNEFMKAYDLKPAFIASHGHTWFHVPEKRINQQIGDGFELYRLTNIPVINDFRSLDIRMGGQGAPLVPIGDELLFSAYDCCVNLGGIANISGKVAGKRLSFDVAPFNLVLNYLSEKLGMVFDENGNQARKGNTISDLKSDLEKLPYFSARPPKSLGIEWLNEKVFPLLEIYSHHQPVDLLNTYIEFSCEQLVKGFESFDNWKRVLLTGGGTHNQYFVERLKQIIGENSEVVIPSAELIDFKEAMVFAFLGLLRLENQVNCLKEVTGASFSASGGVIYDQYIQ